jgi:hypothetical protein
MFKEGDRVELLTTDEPYNKGVAESGIAEDGKVLVRWDVGTESRVLATRIRRVAPPPCGQ